MNIIIIGVVALMGLGLIAGVITLLSKKQEGESDVVQPTSGDCSTCTGIADSCEQVCMMEAATKQAEYYDDEELDRFIGRSSEKLKNLPRFFIRCNLMKLRVGIGA